MLDQRRRRWADVVQMLYKCFVFAGNGMFLAAYARFFTSPYNAEICLYKPWRSKGF